MRERRSNDHYGGFDTKGMAVASARAQDMATAAASFGNRTVWLGSWVRWSMSRWGGDPGVRAPVGHSRCAKDHQIEVIAMLFTAAVVVLFAFRLIG